MEREGIRQPIQFKNEVHILSTLHDPFVSRKKASKVLFSSKISLNTLSLYEICMYPKLTM